MQKQKVVAFTLLLSASIFIFFNYIPTQMELSALENESEILKQVVSKQNELTRLLWERNEQLFRRSMPAQVTSQEKKISSQPQEAKAPMAVKSSSPKGNQQGNQGFLMKKGKVL